MNDTEIINPSFTLCNTVVDHGRSLYYGAFAGGSLSGTNPFGATPPSETVLPQVERDRGLHSRVSQKIGGIELPDPPTVYLWEPSEP